MVVAVGVTSKVPVASVEVWTSAPPAVITTSSASVTSHSSVLVSPSTIVAGEAVKDAITGAH